MGEIYYGMLQGDGTDIRFALSTADGFTTPPGPDVRLKEFLREASGLKLEPSYVIVDKPTTGEQGDEDAAADDSEESQATESVTADSGSSVAQEGLEDKFVRFLKSILPHVKRALANKTSVSDELQQYVRKAQEFGRRREFDPGLAALRKVGELTKKRSRKLKWRRRLPRRASRQSNRVQQRQLAGSNGILAWRKSNLASARRLPARLQMLISCRR